MSVTESFVTLQTDDKQLSGMHKRIEKLSLLGIWVGKASSLFERYFRILEQNDNEKDKVKIGINIEEIDICFMSSISYFLRCFLHQKGSLNLEIKHVTQDQTLRDTYRMLYDLRNDEYVHWKGARSQVSVRYSFAAITPTVCEFAKTVQVEFQEKIGPEQHADDIRRLFQVTMEHIENRRNKELADMRVRLAKLEAWSNTNFYNDKGQPIIKKSAT